MILNICYIEVFCLSCTFCTSLCFFSSLCFCSFAHLSQLLITPGVSHSVQSVSDSLYSMCLVTPLVSGHYLSLSWCHGLVYLLLVNVFWLHRQHFVFVHCKINGFYFTLEPSCLCLHVGSSLSHQIMSAMTSSSAFFALFW